MLNFNGETGPYLQYMFVRTNSILNKAENLPSISNIDVSLLEDNASTNLIKAIYEFGNIVIQAAEKHEPYIISRYLIKIAQLFSTFYNENRIIGEDKKSTRCKNLSSILYKFSFEIRSQPTWYGNAKQDVIIEKIEGK